MDEEYSKKKRHGIDLHIHSTNSDGIWTVPEIIRVANAERLSAISITDHNYCSIRSRTYVDGMEIIPGCEFSTTYISGQGRKIEIHIIGLFFQDIEGTIDQILEKNNGSRRGYLDKICRVLQSLRMEVTYDLLRQRYPNTQHLGRRQIGDFLVERGYAVDREEAFDCYIGNRSPYFVDSAEFLTYVSMEECVAAICKSKGIPILAHPYHYSFSSGEIKRLISRFNSAVGGYPAGIEVYYGDYSEEWKDRLLKYCEKYGLLQSAGSDSHGPERCLKKSSDSLLSNMKRVYEEYYGSRLQVESLQAQERSDQLC